MNTHDLKIWPEFFEDVISGAKRYEVRFNRHDFQVGDTLLLREWSPKTVEYSGRECSVRVMHISKGTEYPLNVLLQPNVVVMGIELIAQ